MRHRTKLKIRFGDTDMLGHVNNASYFTYMEEGRTQFLLDVMGMTSFPLILASAKVDFLAQTFFGQTLIIESFISRMGNSSFDITSRMLVDETNEAVFEGVATVVHFNYETQRSERVPDTFRRLVADYIEVSTKPGAGE